MFKYSLTTLPVLLVFSLLLPLQAQQMDNARLLEILNKAATVKGEPGVWEVDYKDRFILVITDELANRMRMISPIKEEASLTQEELRNALLANFHTALDVKYAISEGVMWSVFIHPLAELREAQLIDALNQVHEAAETFGTTYSSTDLMFPGGGEKDDPSEKKNPTKKM